MNREKADQIAYECLVQGTGIAIAAMLGTVVTAALNDIDPAVWPAWGFWTWVALLVAYAILRAVARSVWHRLLSWVRNG